MLCVTRDINFVYKTLGKILLTFCAHSETPNKKNSQTMPDTGFTFLKRNKEKAFTERGIACITSLSNIT